MPEILDSRLPHLHVVKDSVHLLLVLLLQGVDGVQGLVGLLKALLHLVEVLLLRLELLRMQELQKVVYRANHVYDRHATHDDRTLADLVSNLVIEQQLPYRLADQREIQQLHGVDRQLPCHVRIHRGSS